MALRATVTDLESIDEAARSLYVQKDGRYVLDVEAADGFALDNIAGLKAALTSERNSVASLKTKVSAYEGLDADAARAALARVTEFGDLDPKKAKEALANYEKFVAFDPEKEADKLADAKFKNAKAQLQADFLADKSQLEEKIKSTSEVLARREAQIKKGLKETAISAELAKLNPIDDARDALEMMAFNVVHMHEVNGEFVPVVVNADGTPRTKLNAVYDEIPFTISDLMAEMREKRAALFKPDPTRGAGLTPPTDTPPSQGAVKNPFIPGPHFNLTEQMVLLRTDPKKAAAFQAEAGR